MKHLFTLLMVLMSVVGAKAQVDVTCEPALPYTFDESWSGNFLATPGKVAAVMAPTPSIK